MTGMKTQAGDGFFVAAAPPLQSRMLRALGD